MAFFGSILERTKTSLPRNQETASRRMLKFMIALGCVSIAFSLYGFLVVEEAWLGPLASLLVGVGLLLEGAAVVSYTNRPTLAALLRITNCVVVIFLFVVVALIFLYS